MTAGERGYCSLVFHEKSFMTAGERGYVLQPDPDLPTKIIHCRLARAILHRRSTKARLMKTMMEVDAASMKAMKLDREL